MSKDPERPAFPVSSFYPGLTVREYVATQTLQGLLAGDRSSYSYGEAPGLAVELADELLEKLGEQS